MLRDGTALGLRGLTNKQRAYALALLQGKTKQEATKLAGYHSKYVPHKRYEFQRYLDALLDSYGLNDDTVARLLIEGLQAYQVKVDPNGDEHAVPDFFVRHKYVETLIRLRNLFPPTRQELTGSGGGPVIVRATPSVGHDPFEEGDDEMTIEGDYDVSD